MVLITLEKAIDIALLVLALLVTLHNCNLICLSIGSDWFII